MDLLHRSHPHAFPQALTIEKKDGKTRFISNSKPNALTLKEFKALYNECGEILHRGTIKSLEESNTISKNDYDKVIQWSHKIVDLLNQHLIARPGGRSMYLVSLRSEKGAPAISILNFDETGGVEVIERHINLSDQKS